MRLTRKSLWLVFLALSLAVGTYLRLWIALTDNGIYWPDEIYQSLEPAHRLVYGFGLIAWEFADGARNWTLPGLVAGLLKVCDWLHWDDPRHYIPFVKATFALAGAATGLGVYRLARNLGVSQPNASLATLAFALSAPMIYFAPRAMSEIASALPAVFGLALFGHEARRRRVVGAALLGLAVLFRLQNGIFCIGALAQLCFERRWRHLLEVSIIFALCAFGYGLLDKLTWGSWFHSPQVYFRFNVVEGKAAIWGTDSWSYYLLTLWTSMPALGWLILALAIAAIRSTPVLVLTAMAFIALHSATPHKEFRFLVPVMPLLCALAGVGLESLASWGLKRLGFVAALAVGFTAVFSAARFHSLTFGDLGHYRQLKPNASAYDDFGSVNRLLLAAHDLPDVCGIKFEVVHLAWTGGITYLHRPVPLYTFDGPPRESGIFNYVVTWPGRAPASRVAASDGNFILAKVNDSCRLDSGYSWRLP